MANCLVLGGNGFIGSNVVEILINNGYNVKVFDNFLSGINNLKNVSNKIELIKGDFLGFKNWKEILADVDYVFHYIGLSIPQTSIKDPISDINNIIGSIKLFQEAVNVGVKKVIFPSSAGTVYGEPKAFPIDESHPTDPINPYGITKLAVEKYLYWFYTLYGLDYTIFRYSNPYGEGQNPRGGVGAVNTFLWLIKNNKPLTVFGDGETVRDFVYIKDVANVNLLAIQKNTKNKIFNLGSGIGTSVNELIRIISEVLNVRPQINYTEGRKGDATKIILDISRVKKELGWEPKTQLIEGIKRTWLWLQKLP